MGNNSKAVQSFDGPIWVVFASQKGKRERERGYYGNEPLAFFFSFAWVRCAGPVRPLPNEHGWLYMSFFL